MQGIEEDLVRLRLHVQHTFMPCVRCCKDFKLAILLRYARHFMKSELNWMFKMSKKPWESKISRLHVIAIIRKIENFGFTGPSLQMLA